MSKAKTFIRILVTCGCTFLITATFLTGKVRASNAAIETASICEAAAAQVSRETGVPVDVLRAITLTETGRKGADGFLPWPWTVNMEGVGKWFDDRKSARSYVDRHFKRGARSFDVGCFQINYRWHGDAFASIDEMFDPIANARYAAKFLNELFGEFGDWTKAAGAYHSRTPKFAKKYAARFDRIRARLPDYEIVEPIVPVLRAVKEAEPTAPIQLIARINRYPLLQPGQTGGIASLVPLSQSGTPRFLEIVQPRQRLELR